MDHQRVLARLALLLARLNAEADKIVQSTEVQEKFKGMGMESIGGPPERLAEILASDTAKWAKVVKEAKITMQ